MRILRLSLNPPCKVRIGPLEPIGGPAFVICDRRVRGIARRIARGRPVLEVVSGERRKTPTSLVRLWSALAAAGADRYTKVVAVGGGMLTDLAGLAAATYMRGVPLIHVPTTLLAQVDAAIGGKTAINLPAGKNLVGAFYQPREVRIDSSFLRTLSPRHYRTGLAEVVKYGVISDPAILELLERNIGPVLKRERRILDEIIFRCVRIKLDVVRRDERESGPRMMLNYGHTVGHALERTTEYRLTHGEAISIGMEVEARIAARLGLCGPGLVERQRQLLRALGLPVRVPGQIPDILQAMALDKKGKAGRIRFVLPRRIGKVVFPVPVERSVIAEALRGKK